MIKCLEKTKEQRIYLEWLVQLPFITNQEDFVPYQEYFERRTGKNIVTKSDDEIINEAKEVRRYFDGD